MQSIKITENDWGTYLTFYLKEENEVGEFMDADITGASSVVFEVQKYTENTLCVQGTCEILSYKPAKVRYLITQKDFDWTGKGLCELHVYYPSGRVTWEHFEIDVRSELPK